MKDKKLKKNLLYNVIYQILILFLPLVTSSYTSKIVGADGIGMYSYSYSIALYFSYFVLLGLNTYGNRLIASLNGDRKRISEAFSELYTIQIACFLLVFIIYIIYAWNWAKYRTVALIQAIFLLSSFFDINWFFFGREMFDKTVVRNIVVKVLTTILIFANIKAENDINKYTFIMSLGYLLSQVALWPYVLKNISFSKVRFECLKKHLKPNLMMFLPVIAISIYKVMDKIMLGNMCTPSQVGYYENAERIVNVPVAVITAFGTVMLPRVSSLVASQNEDQVKKYREYVMTIVTAFSCGAALGIIAVSDQISLWMYGPSFSMSGKVMKYLAVTVIFLGCGNVLRTQYLIPYGKDKVYINSAFIGAIVNFVINAILIPRYQAVGAAIGTICAEAAVAGYQFLMVKNCIPLKKYLLDAIWYTLVGVIMCFIIAAIPPNTILFLDIVKKTLVGIFCFCVGAVPYLILRLKKWRDECA